MLIRRLRVYVLYAAVMALYSCSSRSLALQLFTELTEEEAITDATTILTIQAEAIKEKGPVAHFSVCLSCIPFTQPRSVWTIPLTWESLRWFTWLLLLFYGRCSQMSPAPIRISPFTACFFVYTGLLSLCRTGPARLCKSCRADTARFSS